MSEKSVFPSRLLSCLIAVSMFFLVLSSLFMFRYTGSSVIPISVYNRILYNINKTSGNAGPSLVVPSQILHKPVDRPKQPVLKVYMYDLPPEFHLGLLGWKGSVNQTWPNVSKLSEIPPYPGGLNLQHSIEYWLTLDLLSSNAPNVPSPHSALRIQNSSEADIIFVPFFASLSYNRYSKIQGNEKTSLNRVLQDRLVRFLKEQDEWKRFGGKDHLIVAHHPNSMLDARKKLGSAMFVLADFGRYPVEIANINKDVIAPYKHVVRTVAANDSAPFEGRPILAYFQGAIYRKDVSQFSFLFFFFPSPLRVIQVIVLNKSAYLNRVFVIMYRVEPSVKSYTTY